MHSQAPVQTEELRDRKTGAEPQEESRSQRTVLKEEGAEAWPQWIKAKDQADIWGWDFRLSVCTFSHLPGPQRLAAAFGHPRAFKGRGPGCVLGDSGPES